MSLSWLRRGSQVVFGAALVAAGTLSACGGGTTRQPTSGEPAAAIDPSSNNSITGPINKARAVSDDAEARDRRIEQMGGGGQP